MELEEVRRIYRPSALWSQKPLVSHSESPADKSIDFSLDLWSLRLRRTTSSLAPLDFNSLSFGKNFRWSFSQTFWHVSENLLTRVKNVSDTCQKVLMSLFRDNIESFFYVYPMEEREQVDLNVGYANPSQYSADSQTVTGVW